MKKLMLSSLAMLTLLVTLSCSGDSDSNNSPTTFSVNGENYTLLSSEGIVNLVSPNAYELDGNSYNRNTFVICPFFLNDILCPNTYPVNFFLDLSLNDILYQ